MKKALSVFGQFLVFVALLLGVFLWDPLHLKWFVSHPTPVSTRYFVPDGYLVAAGLFVVVLVIEAAAKRLRDAGLLTTIAFALALLVSVIGGFGWGTHDLF